MQQKKIKNSKDSKDKANKNIKVRLSIKLH